jgi:hypothetical protein
MEKHCYRTKLKQNSNRPKENKRLECKKLLAPKMEKHCYRTKLKQNSNRPKENKRLECKKLLIP